MCSTNRSHFIIIIIITIIVVEENDCFGDAKSIGNGLGQSGRLNGGVDP